VAICVIVAYPIVGLFLLLGVILLIACFYLWDVYCDIRIDRLNKAWNALPETKKDEWEKVYVKDNAFTKYEYWTNGIGAFRIRFCKEFGLFDAFSKEFKKEIPIPKKDSFWKGIRVEK